ncbi:hypothetical protein O3P69_012967 [Scylla paramamosain]|uniref:Integrase catalytic domain-containing protein n=1 Tax=Scylla paramamosain TaxID=85552 RepID=A0AAW0TTS0_SCYPA
MATPNRPVVRTRRSPAIASRGLTSALAQARAVIQVQQQALSSLQAGLTAADSSGHGGHPARQPLTSAPENKQAAPASPLSEVSSAVTVADAHSTPQPTIDVIVSRGDGKEERKASAVADTGAQWEGHTYMAYADWLTGWLEVAHFPNGASSYKIQTQLRKYFSRYGAPEHMSMDGGTNLTSAEMDTFYRNWGVSVRLSSAQYPQSNGRAEVAVKTAKRIIRDNTSPGGSLDNDKATLAILQYLNTPLRCINKSPAQLATGRQLRDGVPMAGQHLRLDQYWSQTLRKRERLMAEEQEAVTALDTPRSLQPLSTGARVRIQNQASNRWDRTGVITEVLPYRQYTVRLDGSGRLSLRNRRHLRCVKAGTGSTPGAPPTANPSSTPTGTTSAPQDRRPSRNKKRPLWLKDYEA